MWKITCNNCKKTTEIRDLDVIDKEKGNMNMVTVIPCNHCNTIMEISVSVIKSQGLIEF